MDTDRLPLSRASVDRAAHLRDDDLLARALTAPGTRVVLLHAGRLAVRRDPASDGGDAASVALDLRPATALADATRLPGRRGVLWLFLGAEPDGTAYLAGVLPDEAGRGVDIEGVPAGGELGRLVEETTWAALRDVGHALADADAGLAATAVGLAAWHERHPRCPRCGEPTEPALAGWTRRCTAEGTEQYPRTDPAVIMAVTDDADRLLLGHAAHWPDRRFSTLAGYVEPGESLEAAVRREVAEETGVVVGEVAYQGSQPWPFPASLMVAYRGRALTTDVTVDGVEMTDARWFTREDLAADVAAGRVLLPMRTSVARALIEDWYGGPLTTDERW